MTDDAWRRDPTVRPRLHAALGYLTQALRKSPDESLTRCERLADASNQLWFIYRLQQGRPKDSDWQAVKGMLTEGTPAERRGKLAADRSLRRLAEFRPYIENHHALLEAGDPWDPPDELRRRAERPHRRFARAWEAWRADAREESERRLLTSLAEVVSVVRGNIAHGEKTAQGPTRGVGERNQAAAAVMESAWWAIFESPLDHPCHRLAVYGTLARGKVNASLLESLEGTWEPGAVRGSVTEIAGLPAATPGSLGRRGSSSDLHLPLPAR
jgi:hypothetical protein